MQIPLITSPKGKLIAIGGAEDKGAVLPGFSEPNQHFYESGILKRFISEMNGKDSRIEVITTASMIPEEVGVNYLEAFEKLGVREVGIMDIRDRKDTKNPDFLERLRNCDGVMFSGGNQLRLSSIFGGTGFLNIIKERFVTEENFVVAGTSAGAMAMSNTMIYEGDSAKAHLKAEVKMSSGLAFMNSIIIDSHFDARGRFTRLAQSVAGNPGCVGVGLGEDTGIIITHGNEFEVIGSGSVIIIDGHDMKHSNFADIEEGRSFSAEQLMVHMLVSGNKYLLRERTYIAPPVVLPEIGEIGKANE